MKVILDENGYVAEWCSVGDNGGVEYPDPDDFDDFFVNYRAYKVLDGRLVLDETKLQSVTEDKYRELLRRERAEECFPVVNRGVLWYNMLSSEQRIELDSWYKNWLDAPSTLQKPSIPGWLK